MKLALALGWQSVEIMLTEMSFCELKDWEAYYSVEPFPDERADFRNAHAMALLANINVNPDKHAPFTTEDFMPDYWKMQQEIVDTQTVTNEVMHVAYMINAAFGGKVVKRDEVIQ